MPLSWADDVAPARKPGVDCAGVFASVPLPPDTAGDSTMLHELDLGMLREGSHYRVYIDVQCKGGPGMPWQVQCEGGPGMQIAAAMVPRPSVDPAVAVAAAVMSEAVRLQVNLCCGERGSVERVCEIALQRQAPVVVTGSADAGGGSAGAAASASALLQLKLRARVMDRGTGTPLLKAGVECVGREPTSDEETEWAGFCAENGGDDGDSDSGDG